jgi:phage shock protein E
MKNSRILWIVLLMVSILATACAPTAAPVAAAVDINNLPRDVDVDTVASLLGNEDVLILDVREQHEYDEGHIPGVVLIPVGEVPVRLDEIPMDKPVIVTCRSGNRSNQITLLLEETGYENVHNMLGGIVEWESSGYDVVIP